MAKRRARHSRPALPEGAECSNKEKVVYCLKHFQRSLIDQNQIKASWNGQIKIRVKMNKINDSAALLVHSFFQFQMANNNNNNNKWSWPDQSVGWDFVVYSLGRKCKLINEAKYSRILLYFQKETVRKTGLDKVQHWVLENKAWATEQLSRLLDIRLTPVKF